MLPRSPWRTARPARDSVQLWLPRCRWSLPSRRSPAPRRPRPSDQPGGTTGGARQPGPGPAAAARRPRCRTGLQEQQARGRRGPGGANAAEGGRRRRGGAGRRRGRARRHQEVVAWYAAAVYRDGGAVTPLTVLLSGGDPGDMVSALGFLDVVDAHAAAVIGAAEAHGRRPSTSRSAPRAALDAGAGSGPTPWPRGGRARGGGAAVTDELDEALGASTGSWRSSSRSSSRSTSGRRRTGRRTSTSSRRPGSTPPPAAALLDPAAGLPRPGAGRARRRRRPARRRTAARASPLAAGAAGRDARRGHRGDGRARAALRAGHRRAGVVGLRLAGAVGLRRGRHPAPRRPGRAVRRHDAGRRRPTSCPATWSSSATPESGLGHVGIALDAKTMLAADARAGAVVVRTLPADQVLGIGRPSLGQRAPVAGPGPPAGR